MKKNYCMTCKKTIEKVVIEKINEYESRVKCPYCNSELVEGE